MVGMQRLETIIGHVVSLPAQGQANQQCSPLPTSGADKPKLIYFPIAGRGELARLIAAVGGVELEDEIVGMGPPAKKAAADFFGALPILTHGSLRICQSQAIQKYLAAIGPKFQGLTVQQRAVDDMYCGINEDVLAGCANVLFGNPKSAPEKIPPHLDKFFGSLEGLVPASGFINGLSHPTVADLAVLVMMRAALPLEVSIKAAGGYDMTKFPKLQALADRTAAAPVVKEYLAASKTFKMIPPGM